MGAPLIYKVGILGCTGRMGLQLCELLGPSFLHQGDCMELADAVSHKKSLVHIEGVEVRTLEEPPREPVHLWIDFSRPEGTMKLLEQIDVPVVIGTTGFSEAETAKIQAYAQKHPVLLAANTSPGMNLIYHLIGEMAGASWVKEVAIHEEHHRNKKDSPSGTAKELKRQLETAGFSGIQVSAVRGGSTPGLHIIKLMGDDEEIAITHRAMDRRVFARGALMAGRVLLKNKPAGLYKMKDLIKET